MQMGYYKMATKQLYNQVRATGN